MKTIRIEERMDACYTREATVEVENDFDMTDEEAARKLLHDEGADWEFEDAEECDAYIVSVKQVGKKKRR